MAAQDRDGIGMGRLRRNRADGVKPEPAAHRVQRVAGRVAGARLHLCVLVGDEVAAMKFIGLQAVVEGECIERHRKRDRTRRNGAGGAARCFSSLGATGIVTGLSSRASV